MALLLAWASIGLRRCGPIIALALLCIAKPVAAEEKALHGVALVIGQSDYEALPALTNPANDAKAIERLLSDLGFDVDLVANADRKKLSKSLSRFVEDAEGADVAMIYYSGHGIEAGGENFLVPVDADVSALDKADQTLVPVSALIAELQAKVPVTIVLLDACRSNPFPPGAMVKLEDGAALVPVAEGGLGTPRGVVSIAGKQNQADGLGAVIGYAAAPGQVALDGDAGSNSPYAAALLKHLPASGFAFSDVMTMVTEEVYLKTGARQVPWTNASLRRLLYFGGTPEEAEDGDQALIRGERRKLLLTISAFGDIERQQVVAKARQDGVPMDALFAMLKAVGADTPQDPEQLSKLLSDQAVRLKSLLDERQTMKSADSEIARLSGLANEAVSEGALETAIAFRERAKERVSTLTSTVDQAENDLKAKRAEFAAVFGDSGDTYALAYDNARAAEDFAKAYEQVARWDEELALHYKLKEARALSDLGFYKADEAANQRAGEAYRMAAALAPADKNPGDWAKAQSGLAMSIWATGERAAGTDALNEAVAILTAAIASPSLADKPEQTAQLQADLSLVQMTLGMREPGTEMFEASATSARQALKVKTRAAAPYEWARLQNHLGSALLMHGMREQSLDRVEEAATAFRAALEVWTREMDPLAWANAENNLGLAIGQIGSRQPTSDKLEEAVGLLKQALEVRTREIAPLSWAETLTNLAATYYDLGLRAGGDIQWYQEGASSLREAMQEITRERDPLKWAALQDNLGLALGNIGAATGDVKPLGEALDAYNLALTERQRERVPLDWASTMNNIGNVHYRLGEFNHDPKEFDLAVATFTAALEERTRERTPSGWASTQNNLANALGGLGGYEDGIKSLSEACDHYRLALEEYPRDVNPVGYADTQYNIALTLLAIAKKTGEKKDFDATRAAIEESHSVYIEAGQTQYESYFEDLRLGVQIAETDWVVKKRLKELQEEEQKKQQPRN